METRNTRATFPGRICVSSFFAAAESVTTNRIRDVIRNYATYEQIKRSSAANAAQLDAWVALHSGLAGLCVRRTAHQRKTWNRTIAKKSPACSSHPILAAAPNFTQAHEVLCLKSEEKISRKR